MSDAVYSAALVGCGKIGSLFADDPLMKGDIFSHAGDARQQHGEVELLVVSRKCRWIITCILLRVSYIIPVEPIHVVAADYVDRHVVVVLSCSWMAGIKVVTLRK